MVLLIDDLFSLGTLLIIPESKPFCALEISSYRLEMIDKSLDFQTLFLKNPLFPFQTNHPKLDSEDQKANLIMFIGFQ